MRHIIILLTFVFTSLTASAQNYKNDGEPYDFYCEMTAEENLAGQLRLTLEWNTRPDFGREQLRDENGKKIEFASVVEMFNYMSKRGWKYVESYNYGNTLHFLFKKQVRTDEEAKEGLIFKSDKNK